MIGHMITCAYILAKDESRNIGRCLDALVPVVGRVVVLDSGSSDGTQNLASAYPGVSVQAFQYRNHLSAYNELSAAHPRESTILVLDADMVVSGEVIEEITAAFAADPAVDAVRVPLAMWWDGLPLRHANMCPPKAIAFRGGAKYFEQAGHGERLGPEVRVHQIRSTLVHDDRKPYGQVLVNQWRYAREVSRRARRGRLPWPDRLRVRTPLMLLLIPLYTLIKGGLLDGRAGVIYALDRLIYEVLAYRAAISPAVAAELDAEESPTDSKP
jgi:hypothetical protein